MHSIDHVNNGFSLITFADFCINSFHKPLNQKRTKCFSHPDDLPVDLLQILRFREHPSSYHFSVPTLFWTAAKKKTLMENGKRQHFSKALFSKFDNLNLWICFDLKSNKVSARFHSAMIQKALWLYFILWSSLIVAEIFWCGSWNYIFAVPDKLWLYSVIHI